MRNNGNNAAMERKNVHDDITKSPINLKQSIESNYIFIYIFSFLDENKKLNILIYNKKIKKKLGININNYIKQSGKIYIGKRNGFGEEYLLNTNVLIFEGEYLNGKKNGKGKEYYNNGLL